MNADTPFFPRCRIKDDQMGREGDSWRNNFPISKSLRRCCFSLDRIPREPPTLFCLESGCRVANRKVSVTGTRAFMCVWLLNLCSRTGIRSKIPLLLLEFAPRMRKVDRRRRKFVRRFILPIDVFNSSVSRGRPFPRKFSWL